MTAVDTIRVPETEAEMNAYTIHELAKIHLHELIAAADHARLVKEARMASRGTGVPVRWPLIWLREATGRLAARLVSRPLATGRPAPDRAAS